MVWLLVQEGKGRMPSGGAGEEAGRWCYGTPPLRPLVLPITSPPGLQWWRSQSTEKEEALWTSMDEHGLARGLGWVSIGVGLAVIAAPAPLMNAFGLGDRPNLGRFLGVRDLVLGVGILRGQNVGAWGRGIADALDGALILGGAVTGAFRRDRAPIGLAAAAGFSALSFWLAED